MSQQIITPADILELIKEVGQVIELCEKTGGAAADVNLGMPSSSELSCRTIRAYCVSINMRALPQDVAQTIMSGDRTLYVLARDLNPSELTGHSFIRFEGRIYQIERQEDMLHRGQPLLYRFLMRQTLKTVAVPGPTPAVELPIRNDGVLRFGQGPV